MKVIYCQSAMQAGLVFTDVERLGYTKTATLQQKPAT